jgi:hypothetical protein
LRGIYGWLACADPPGADDLLFVLAGREDRKRHALRLFREGSAHRLLLSVGRFEIRRFRDLDLPQEFNLQEIASQVPPPLRHFFLSFDGHRWNVDRIPRGRFGTLSEIRALEKWLEGHPEIASIALVSSGAHLRRVRMCCRALLPARIRLRLVAVPESPADLERKDGTSSGDSFEFILSELVKLACYRLMLALAGARRRSV